MVNPPLWQLPDPPAGPVRPVQSSIRPPAIRRAVPLMYAGAALSVAYALMVEASAHSTTTASASRSSAYEAGQYAGALLAGLVLGGLWLWMAAKNRAGRRWARILSTVFFGFWCLQLLASLVVVAIGKENSAFVAVFIVILADWIVGLTALILLWKRESSDYFAAT